MSKPNNRTRSTARAVDKEDNVSTVMTIHRRFPRLGSSYQTKVPLNVEDSYQPSRQTPVLLSKEHPDVANSDVNNDMILCSGESHVDIYPFFEVEGTENALGF
jgi:hypothetical protein